MLIQRLTRLSLLSFVLLVTIALSSCKEDTMSSLDDTSDLGTTDAATAIAASIGSDNGGLNDQLSDISDLALGNNSFSAGVFSEISSDGLFNDRVGPLPPIGAQQREVTRNGVVNRRSYDSTTQVWTVTLVRTFSGLQREASWSRQYKYRYSRAGVGQQFLRSQGNPADRIDFEIVPDSCTGFFRNPVMSHRLLRLEGKTTGTFTFGTDTTIRINTTVPFVRTSTDTMSRGNVRRTSTQTLTVSLRDVIIPVSKNRRIRGIYSRPISGVMSGQFRATITSSIGETLRERQITRDFTIDFASDTTSDRFRFNVGGFGARGMQFIGGLEDGMLRP